MTDLRAAPPRVGARLSIRRGVLRFSIRRYNDEEGVDRVLAAAARSLTSW